MTYDTTGTGTTRGASTATSQASGAIDFPIDDSTYNLLQALTSKLESIDAYRTYMQEDASGLFKKLAEEDSQHARELLDQLRQKLGSATGR